MKLLYDYALQFCNIPYKWGGNDPMEGLDCSGLVRILLHSEGLHVAGLNAQSLFEYFKANHTDIKYQLGAVVFYGSLPNAINHVALCLNGYQQIEAAGGDSSTTTLEVAETKNAFVRVTPIRIDQVIACFMPNYPFKETD